ncbi:serine/threonine-protein kinase [Streptomyces sp. SYSU K217416]
MTGTPGTRGPEEHGPEEYGPEHTDGVDSPGGDGATGRFAPGGRGLHVPGGYRVGDWEVTEPIATGGWGSVFKGRRAPDARVPDGGGDVGRDSEPEVALKFLPTAGLAPWQARQIVETARREVDFGRRADHPRLIRLLDSAVVSDPDGGALDGAVVLVMERAAGSLQDLLHAADGRPPEEAPRLLAEVCEGLAHLHGLGWVHGDLKPDNVLIMADGSARLSDFGLTSELDGTRGTHGYMPPLGSPDYLPPERWNAPLGERGVLVRPTADIWALGIMIHQLFTGGSSPFPGATPTSRGAAVQEYASGRAPLRMPAELPSAWREMVADCLAPTHEARAEHSAQSLLERILAAGQETLQRPVPRPRRSRRHRWAAGLATTGVVGCLGAAAWWQFGSGAGWWPGGSGAPPSVVGSEPPAGPRAQVTVFNVEPQCAAAKTREPKCSMGLARDPLVQYTIDNVVPTRVWHGDVLTTDCSLPSGQPVTDEVGKKSTHWFRIRLSGREKGADGAQAPSAEPEESLAWLPGVRTKDRPEIPTCTP